MHRGHAVTFTAHCGNSSGDPSSTVPLNCSTGPIINNWTSPLNPMLHGDRQAGRHCRKQTEVQGGDQWPDRRTGRKETEAKQAMAASRHFMAATWLP